jgi:thiol-disulfide isomerase/thioredoxin
MVVVMLLLTCAAFAEELAVGAKAPGFSLVNAVDDATVTMKPDDGKVKVVVFTCNSCPYAKAFESRIIGLANQFGHQGVSFYAIDPNDDTKYPDESLANMKARATEKGYPFPYLKDGDSKIARAYGARVTPHVFLLDADGTVRYRGYIDDSAKPAERTNEGLSNALKALLGGREIGKSDTRAFGCTIKWADAR